MRLLLQRVSRASVTVEGQVVARIDRGWLLFVGVARGDTEADADWSADKVALLRTFPDDSGKMNRNISEAGGGILVVSQFTLLANCRAGRRPSFTEAAPPAEAERLYLRVAERLASTGLPVATGVFAADMKVDLLNDGPVTFWLDSRKDA